ncbi:glycosyltransferase family 4 protein [Rothia sp. AR01]|uniref:D-inositol 3-phosphate glycosyltransferase n=1 Tax=Rothia santali TaxID=2949643 RepID=A0A9X2HBB8_9MICC|nr:glycosyltransferase [Rothia santali]MCP3426186.1 glycosyltransferase family 4 protein [Rothia santali]
MTTESRLDIAQELKSISGLSVEKARIAHRELALRSGLDGRSLVAYGRFLIAQSEARAAEEILALALERDGANVPALELYLTVLEKIGAPSGRLAWALKRLEESVVLTPGAHRAALDYLIPYRRVAALEVLGRSPDLIVRAVVAVNAIFADRQRDSAEADAILDELKDTDRNRVLLTVSMARGNGTLLEQTLHVCADESIPEDSTRRAIRRAQRQNKPKMVETLLRAYLRRKPQDRWAKQQLEKLPGGAFSNYRLGQEGFPLPPAASSAAYQPVDKKVFYLLHNSLPHHSAGYATRTHGLLHQLNRSGWDVDGVTRLGYPYDMPGKADLPDVAPHDVVDGVDYIRLLHGREIEKKNPLYHYTQRYSKALEGLARTERPSIIHGASNHWNGLTAVQTARRLGLPSVYEVRGLWEVTRGSRDPEWARSDMFRYMARMEADAADGATAVITITNALRDEMIDRGVDASKIMVVPNGVDTGRFNPIPRDEALATELGVQGKKVIGYVGSVLDYEGIDLMLEATAVMSNLRNDFHVLIVGDGTELQRFQDFVRDNALDNFVTFTGRVPHEDVERYYSLIDITPFPRLALPVCEMVSPLKPFEAMAMGKAVVASNVAALAEIVTPGLNGLLHEKGDAEALRAELERLLDNPELVGRLGDQARRWVVENRDWKSLAGRISDLYQTLRVQEPAHAAL